MSESITVAPAGRDDFLNVAGVDLDPFQQQALDALDRGRSVLVAAPTGAGKTLVADYAVHLALAAGAKAFYTTPLKALSNQKFRDLGRRFGEERVGLLTGDRAVRPRAPVVVMTTEVLRAMQYDRSPLLDGLAAVVLDEFHYLQDPERGPAWEEVVMHLPDGVRLICLSATMGDAALVGEWLTAVHGPTDVIESAARPVPLDYLYAVGHLDTRAPVVLPVFVDGQPNATAELFDGVRRREQPGVLRERSRRRPCPPDRDAVVNMLAGGGLLPAIWFVLSRDGCDAAVRDLAGTGERFTSEAERHRLDAMAAAAVAGIPRRDQHVLGCSDWTAALGAGIAAHHGGLLPAQREVVEHAAAEGLVKVVFATETLALGVNLPARTVVVDRLVRADGGGGLLSGADFAQLAGRAGRRGLDASGTVVVPWSAEVPFQRVVALAGGQIPTIESKFRLTPTMAANLHHRHGAGAAAALRRSLLQHLRDRDVVVVAADRAARRQDLDEARESAVVEDATDDDGNADWRATIATGLRSLNAGDVFVDPGRPARSRLVVVAPPRVRRGVVTVDALGGDARRVVITERDVRQPPEVVATLAVETIGGSGRGVARRLAAAVAALPEVAVESRGSPPERRVARAAIVPRLEAIVAGLDERLAVLETGLTYELEVEVELLERLGHLRGGELTPSGHQLRRLFHPHALVVIDALTRDCLAGLDAAPLAGAVASLTAGRRDVRPAVRLPGPVAVRVAELESGAARIERETASLGLPPPPLVDAASAGAVFAWAAGAELGDLVRATGASPGDLVRHVRQTADLLREIRAVAAPPVAAVAEAAMAVLLRGSAAGAPAPDPATGVPATAGRGRRGAPAT